MANQVSKLERARKSPKRNPFFQESPLFKDIEDTIRADLEYRGIPKQKEGGNDYELTITPRDASFEFSLDIMLNFESKVFDDLKKALMEEQGKSGHETFRAITKGNKITITATTAADLIDGINDALYDQYPGRPHAIQASEYIDARPGKNGKVWEK